MQVLKVKELVPHPKNEYFFDEMTGQKYNEFREQRKRADTIAKKKWDEQMAKGREILAERAANAPRCPICGSTDLKKIDALDLAISVSFLGLASGKIGKSFKCNHCWYMW